ncbi:low-temperature-induced cysteine proteinase-like [Cucurbita pepo subsp. pepo]|uniref:low-temperature-induced cysteine proteinase-like n=1 Tax=Cucurbita pepo subsp. pepo TaxID=3664 RepID=UPI000C9D7EF5|nr:low-temperature-induced cysteine proteinase-like [Cucurbita pepo subsp. pepo]
MDELQEEYFDWRQHNILTPVRDQKKCNCCWAIAAAGAIESLYNIVYKGQYNNILQAAPQHLIDCLNPNPRDIGPEECYTSTVRKAFKWILSNKGIAKEKDYQFNARRGNCKEFLERKSLIPIKGYEKVDIENLSSKIKEQPITCGIRITNELRRLRNIREFVM